MQTWTRPTWPIAGRLLLVSPHLDDAALSCAALLARSEPVDVMTVFAGQPSPPMRGSWDATTGFVHSGESLPARLREDDAAFADSPHRPLRLPLHELQYVSGPRSALEVRLLASAVERWLADGPGTIAIPAGAGRRPGRLADLARRAPRAAPGPNWHVDHLFVRDRVLRLPAARAVPIVLYEELPYLWGGRPDRRVRWSARRCGRHAEPVVAEIDRDLKASRLAAYASQLPHLAVGGRRLDQPESLPRRERYWVLPPPDVPGGRGP
jgi:hypothetical protein